MAEVDWHGYGVVVSSDYRRRIVSALKLGPKTPKELSQATRLQASHVSNCLRELEQLHLVVCLTPELRKGRMFDLTGAGRQIATRLEP
jgi:predicted transcriptional regulator